MMNNDFCEFCEADATYFCGQCETDTCDAHLIDGGCPHCDNEDLVEYV